MTRVVFDTNVIVSGLLWQGIPQRILRSAIQEDLTLLSTEELLAELAVVLERTKFVRYLARTNRTIESTLTLMRNIMEVVIPTPIAHDPVRDPKDKMILECAVGGEADYIVSGDKDLLVLGAYANIPIITPRACLERM